MSTFTLSYSDIVLTRHATCIPDQDVWVDTCMLPRHVCRHECYVTEDNLYDLVPGVPHEQACKQICYDSGVFNTSISCSQYRL